MRRAAPGTLLTFLALLCLDAGTYGPDYGHYLRWQVVARSGWAFALQSDTLAPTGVPLSIWSPGVGLLYGLPSWLASGNLSDAELNAAGYAMGFCFALAMWIALSLLCRRLAGDATLTLACLLLGAVGTQLGFYSYNYASETLSCALIAIAAWWVLAPEPPSPTRGALLGACFGLLLLVRQQMVIFVALGMVVLVYRTITSGKTAREAAATLGSALLPTTLGLVAMMEGNAWMTGSPFRAPHTFGDDGFSSFTPFDPTFRAVLLNPWHGLLVYHPYYLVAFVMVLLGAWRAPTRPERGLWLGVALSGLATLWLYASWYCWWLGTGTFGQRGMSVVAVLLVPASAAFLRREREAGRWTAPWLILLGIAAIWSFGLLLRGNSNFQTFDGLLAAQLETLAGAGAEVVIAIGVAALVSLRAGLTAAIGALALSLGGAALWAAADHGAGATWEPPKVWAAVAAGILVFLGSRLHARRAGPNIGTLIGGGVSVAFLGVLVAFVPLSKAMRRQIEAGPPAGHGFAYRGDVLMHEVSATYHEYLAAPGFPRRKEALRAFIERAEDRQRR